MGIITRDVVKRAQAAKTRAYDYIKDEEPELFNAINDEIATAAKKIGEAITSRNTARVQELFMSSMREILGMTFIAETMSRDIIDSKQNPKLLSIVKLAYESITDTLSKAGEAPESARKDGKDALDAAIDEVTGKE